MSATFIVSISGAIRKEIWKYALATENDEMDAEEISEKILDYLNDENRVSDNDLLQWLYGCQQRTIAEIANDIDL